jgi:hypothetical protein
VNQSAYGSYLIRMARVASPAHDGFRLPDQRQAEYVTWRIEVKHIQRGQEYRFDSVDDLLIWLREQAASLRTVSNQK